MTDPTPRPHRKKLIEVALPLEAINKASAREKSIRHGHPSTLHLWWARRPLAACRAVLFASLVDDPSSDPNLSEEEADRKRDELFAIIEDLVQWENSNNPEVLARARAAIMESTGGNPPPVLDPFCGGGSIPLEAQRLGLEAHGSDLNPVAVLITKALIEIPPKFAGMKPVHPDARRVLNDWSGAQGLAADVRAYGAWMRAEAERRIGHLYPKIEVTTVMARERPDLRPYVGKKLTVIAWIWARTVKSPNPAMAAVHVPLISSFVLSSKAGKEVYVEPVIEDGNYRFAVRSGQPKDAEAAKKGTRAGKAQDFLCLMSGVPVLRSYIRDEGKVGRLGSRLMAIVAEGDRGRVYLSPAEANEAIALQAAENTVVAEARATFLSGSTPTRAMITGGVCSAYGLSTWGHLFTPRQLVALTTFSDLVGEARQRVLADARLAGLPDDSLPLAEGGTGAQAYADAVATYLAFGVSRLSDICNSLCRWESSKTQVRNLFGRQAIPMVWDFAEPNVFADAAGDFGVSLGNLCKVLERLGTLPTGHAEQSDAKLVKSVTAALISTDPPYYDNVGYAELSDFFYVWLRRSLRSIFPDLVSTLLTPKSDEMIASPYRHGGDKERAESFFEEGLGQAFRRMKDIANPAYPVSIYYAFKSTEDAEGEGQVRNGKGAVSSTGWVTMLEGLISAGYSIQSTWPVRSELSNRPIASGTNALASSIVLACLPRSASAPAASRNDFIRALRRELPDALRRLQHGNIAPVDLAQAAIGPGMAIYTRYREVREPSGDRLTVRTALALINQILDEILAEQEGDYDPYTRMAIALFETHGVNEAPYGDAETLATAKGTSVAALVEAGILRSGRGRVALLARDQLPDDWDPARDTRLTVWEITQHLIRALDIGGQDAAARLLRAVGPLGDAARDLAYRLYTVCERKGWSTEAQAYNSLVVAWPEIGRVASEAPVPAGRMQEPLM